MKNFRRFLREQKEIIASQREILERQRRIMNDPDLDLLREKAYMGLARLRKLSEDINKGLSPEL